MGNGQLYKVPTDVDLDVMARTIAGEADSEPLAGQVQIGFCIIKRAIIAAAYVTAHNGKAHPHYGDGSLRFACQTPRQFSCWNVGDSNYARINSMGMRDQSYRWGMYVALATTLRQVNNAFPDATHYFNPGVVTHVPLWVTGDPTNRVPPAKFEGSIGHHRFFSQVPA